MDELSRRVAEASRHTGVPWDEATAGRQWSRLQARRRRRTASRVALAATTVLALAVVGGWQLAGSASEPAPVAREPGPETAPAPQPEPAASPQELRFADGSTAVPDPGASLTAREVSASRVVVELERGRASFAVTPNPEREFVVHASSVRVTVVGTKFAVTRQGERIRVEVAEGRVRVDGAGSSEELGRGDSRWYDARRVEEPAAPKTGTSRAAGSEPDVRRAAQRTRDRAAPQPEGSGSEEAEPDWRGLAERGDFDTAWTALREAGGRVDDDVEDLMLAADTARLSGHPTKALPYLRRVLVAHRDDARAPLAAFTLGRVLLSRLGRPHEAASALRQARTLDPDSSLAEDAMAREVEAWHRAGLQTQARTLAQQYLERYPDGVWVGAVRRYGNLD